MKVFVDANVLVAVLNKEMPLFHFASRVISLAGNSRIELCTTPICLSIAYYFSEKKSGQKAARNKFTILQKYITTIDVNWKDVSNTLADKRIGDIEDGIEYFSAKRAKCQFIVTENVRDFFFSDIPVYNSESFLLHYVKKIKKP
jgi:predicted nucleic acid-binding protein